MKIDMKRLLTLLVVGISLVSVAQNVPAVATLSLAQADPTDADLPRAGVDILRIDGERSTDLRHGPADLVMRIDRDQGQDEIYLVRTALFSEQATVRTSEGQSKPISNRLYTYTGHSSDKDRSPVTMVIYDGYWHLVWLRSDGALELHKRADSDIVYLYSADRADQPHHDCMTADMQPPKLSTAITSRSMTGDCLEVYIEVDNASYTDLGSSTSAVTTWVADLMLQVQGFYEKVGIPLVVSEVFVWTGPDPYQGGDALTVLNAFRDGIQNNYNGRIAQLLTTRDIGGGISEGIGGLCGSYPATPSPYAVAGNLATTVTPLPTYSMSVQLVAHEIGHVLGSRHTHACVWNNTATQIDDCGNVFATNNGGFPEGAACFDANNPVTVSSGTIMSRCELTSTGVDLNLGFHPQVATVLSQSYTTASCLTGVVCASILPGNDLCSAAVPLTVKNSCVPDIYDNFRATASGASPSIGCGSTGGSEDVWFTIEVPASGSFTIESTQLVGGLTDMIIQLYTGSCTSLSVLACDDNSGIGNHAAINVSGRTPGEMVWARVVETGSNQEGTFGLCVYDSSIPCHPSYTSLVDFYNTTNGASWSERSGWQDGAAGISCDVCSWHGILCDQQDNVIQLNLSDNNLIGGLTTTLDVPFLQLLDLSQNTISGGITAWISTLDSLIVLDLSHNALTGSLPTQLSAMDNLSILYLQDNNLTGGLPSIYPSTLDLNALYLHDNVLSGCIPVSYTQYCSADVDLSANSGLSNDDFLTFCSDGLGGDFDADGFCSGGGPNADCLDDDAQSYPGAPELCDGFDNDCNGTADDIVSTTSTWTGSSGSWTAAVDWSTGVVPTACTDVIINGSDAVTIAPAVLAVARSITLDNTAILTIDGQLTVRGSGADGIAVNDLSSIIINGPVRIFDSQDNGMSIAGNCTQSDTLSVSGTIGLDHLVVRQTGAVNNGAASVILLGE